MCTWTVAKQQGRSGVADLQALAEGIAASARRCHGSHELHVLDLLGLAPLPVIPEAVVHPQLQQLKGWDEAKLALLRHIEVINEGYQVLASRWAKHTLQCSSVCLHETKADCSEMQT